MYCYFKSTPLHEIKTLLLEDHLANNAANNVPALKKLHEYIVEWAGEKYADSLFNALHMVK